MITILDLRLWIAGLVIAAVAFFAGRIDERRVWVARQDAASNSAQAKLYAAKERANAAESAIQTKVKEANDDRDKKVAAISNKLATALNELRARPARRADANSQDSGTTGKCAGASGAELSRPDAGFLEREAARADRYVIELNACNARYDGVADSINTLAPSN